LIDLSALQAWPPVRSALVRQPPQSRYLRPRYWTKKLKYKPHPKDGAGIRPAGVLKRRGIHGSIFCRRRFDTESYGRNDAIRIDSDAAQSDAVGTKRVRPAPRTARAGRSYRAAFRSPAGYPYLVCPSALKAPPAKCFYFAGGAFPIQFFQKPPAYPPVCSDKTISIASR
jgi:hypothetical protein